MKNIFITGVTKGIGYAIMEKFIKEGFKVYGTYNSSEIEAESIKKKYKSKIELFKVDFRNQEEIQTLIEKVKGIRFFSLINNAGMFELEDFNNFDLNIWDNTIQVNVKAALTLSLELNRQISPGGSIINISSTDGVTGSFAGMSYSASKAALTNITKSLANNLGPRNIRVNAIHPGWINTGMSTQSSFSAISITPLGRNGVPSDVSELVYFLSSKNASFITGSTITIDGGYSNVDTIMKNEALEL